MKGKHAWIMILCCAIPLLAIFALPLFGIPLGSIGIFLLILLCPLSHILLMRGMHGEHKGQGNNHSNNHRDNHEGHVTDLKESEWVVKEKEEKTAEVDEE